MAAGLTLCKQPVVLALMRGKGKKKSKFLELPNCINNDPGLAGRWHDAFERQAPLLVELAAGRCDFSLGFAAQNPDWNVLAMDLKPERLWAGGRRALARNLPHVRFLRENIERLDELFAPGEIDRIWITFPDPYPKARHAKRRLTGPKFQDMYKAVLAPGGTCHLKTDSDCLWEFTVETLADRQEKLADLEILAYTDDLYQSEFETAENALPTYYEQKWLTETNRTIKYLAWQFLNGSRV